MDLAYVTDADAISAAQVRDAVDGPLLMFVRELGPYWKDGLVHDLPDEKERRRKKDRFAVVHDGKILLVGACSTWPFKDTNPPTKAALPVYAKAGMVLGMHGSTRTRREAICGQGYHTFFGQVYTLDGKRVDNPPSRIIGFNVHSDMGNSEACITMSTQPVVVAARRALAAHPGRRKHGVTGQECYDCAIVHVRQNTIAVGQDDLWEG